MPYTTINKSTDHFNVILRTGDYAGSGTTAITGVGFTPGLMWEKKRNGASIHALLDQVRGNGKQLQSQTNGAETTSSQYASIDSDGFTVNNSGDYDGSANLVSWHWKAGDSNTTVSASGSGNGAINACTYRANTTAGFSIVKYTGRNSDISNGQNTQVTHGLGAKAHFIITKALTGSVNWIVQGKNYNDANLHLNTTDAVSGSEFIGDNRLSTLGTTYFNVGNDNMVNENGVEFISYVFTSISGFSKFGTYTGNGNADGPFVYTGFKPAFLMIKAYTNAQDWEIFDNKRSTFNPLEKNLAANSTSSEQTDLDIDFLSNGFKVRIVDDSVNNSSYSYIYMAFAEAPLVGSNNVPATAR